MTKENEKKNKTENDVKNNVKSNVNKNMKSKVEGTGDKGLLKNHEDLPLKSESWPLPQLGKRGKPIHSSKKEQQQKKREHIENVSRAQRPGQLTAEEITQISEQAEKEGYKAGYDQGFATGEVQGELKGTKQGELRAYKEGKKKLDDQLQHLSAIAKKLLIPMEEQDAEIEEIIIQLAYKIAAEILQTEIKTQPQVFKDLVGQIIQTLPVGVKNYTLFLNPEDASILKEYMQEKNQKWPLECDEKMASGGCRIESRESIIDYSLEKRWREFRDAINHEPNKE